MGMHGVVNMCVSVCMCAWEFRYVYTCMCVGVYVCMCVYIPNWVQVFVGV